MLDASVQSWQAGPPLRPKFRSEAFLSRHQTSGLQEPLTQMDREPPVRLQHSRHHTRYAAWMVPMTSGPREGKVLVSLSYRKIVKSQAAQ